MYYFVVVKSLMAFYDQTLATDAGFLNFVDASIISMTCLFVINIHPSFNISMQDYDIFLTTFCDIIFQ
jgi:folate-dependent phosphoribosylglycinamide formyltransferase PurN